MGAASGAIQMLDLCFSASPFVKQVELAGAMSQTAQVRIPPMPLSNLE